MNHQANYKLLVERYVAKKASEEELAVFFKLVGEGKLDDYLGDAFDEFPRINSKRPPLWRKFAIAAAVLSVISLLTVFLIRKSTDSREITSVRGSHLQNFSTSRGQQKELTLSDGTVILLSAASNIRYPAAFSGEKRVVELEGEGYFNVVRNETKPFLVKLNNGTSVEVTGTNFVVSAYKGEEINATLFEGVIKLQTVRDTATLRPGEEASVQSTGEVSVKAADVEKALSLKNGVLQFDGADVPSVMQQIEKWYDVSVEFEGSVPQTQLSGKIPISASINEVIKILELSNVKSRLVGKKLIVAER